MNWTLVNLVTVDLSLGLCWLNMGAKQHNIGLLVDGGSSSITFGLWMFDLSVIQQMQDQVSECGRAVVGGVQNSIQSFLGPDGKHHGADYLQPSGFLEVNLDIIRVGDISGNNLQCTCISSSETPFSL